MLDNVRGLRVLSSLTYVSVNVACTSFVSVLVTHFSVKVTIVVFVSVQTPLGCKKDEQNGLPVEWHSRME